jgi:hypothetical protein
MVLVEFRDFWGGFDPHENYFSKLFSKMGNVEVVESDGDICIYSCFGASHRTFPGCKVFVTGENWRHDFRDADFCIGFDHISDDRYLRSPLWAWYERTEELRRPYGENITEEKTEFCAFVVSNPDNPMRNRIFKELSRHRHVHSAGQLFNNDSSLISHRGGQSRPAVEYMRRFQFTIAAENSAFPGYTTEKLLQSFIAGSIPIYWGDPLVGYDFDPRAFINFDDYGTVSGLVQAVLEIAEDPAAMDRMRSIVPLSDESWARSANPELLERFFERVFEVGGSPNYKRPTERREPASRTSDLVHQFWARRLLVEKARRRRYKLRILNRGFRSRHVSTS